MTGSGAGPSAGPGAGPGAGWDVRRELGQPILADPQMSAAVRKLNSALAWLDGSRLDRLRDDDLVALAGALAVSGSHLVAVVAELRDELARRGAAIVSSRDGPSP